MNPAEPLPHILIVDDIPENIGVLAAALEKEYDLQFALGGEQALALIAQRAPDLLILDVMMPGIDGLETLRRLRASSWGQSVPVILLTADDRVETQVSGLQLGADDFVAKPVILAVVHARVRNVLERHRLLRQLTASNLELQRLSELNAVLLSSAGQGIYSTDPEGICTSINPAALVMLGYTEAEVVGRHQHDLFHHHHPDGNAYPGRTCPILQTLRDGQQRQVDDAFVRKDGSFLPVQLTVSAMRLEGAIVGSEVIFSDITERLTLQRELQRRATTDELTGLANRRHFFELGETERMRVSRYDHPCALLMLDIDHFKNINDTHGHAAGDLVLKAFSDSIAKQLRATDVFGRIGGEEFAVLLPETDLAGAQDFAERLRAAVATRQTQYADKAIGVTTSIGVTEMLSSDTTFDAAVLRADQRLYDAKASGRNRVIAHPQDKHPAS